MVTDKTVKSNVIAGLIATCVGGFFLLLIEHCLFSNQPRETTAVPDKVKLPENSFAEPSTESPESSTETLSRTTIEGESMATKPSAVPAVVDFEEESTLENSTRAQDTLDQWEQRWRKGAPHIAQVAEFLLRPSGEAIDERPFQEALIKILSEHHGNYFVTYLARKAFDRYMTQCHKLGRLELCRHKAILDRLYIFTSRWQEEAYEMYSAGDSSGLVRRNGRIFRADRIVEIAPGSTSDLQKTIDIAKAGEVIVITEGAYVLDEAFTIQNKADMLLMGIGDVWLVTPMGDVSILSIRKSADIQVSNLKLKHEVPSTGCWAAVVSTSSSERVIVDSSTLDGSGNQALETRSSSSILIVDSIASHNTESVFYSYGSENKDLIFGYNEIFENKSRSGKGILSVSGQRIVFWKNDVFRNKNPRFQDGGDSSGFFIEDNEFSNNSWQLDQL